MLGIEPAMGTSSLHLWIAAGSAAGIVALCALALARPATGVFGSLSRLGIVVFGALLGASAAWSFLAARISSDQGAERSALETRADRLNAAALAPGSSLACLDGSAGEGVETACEKALFATPATVASATSYVMARLTLLADMVAYTDRGGADMGVAMGPLRHSLEADPFGFVAYALAMRDDCTADRCAALAVLHDPSRVRGNLAGQTLQHSLEHYLAVWSDTPVAEAPPQPLTTGELTPSAPHKMVNIDFPTAASIPPVSIMNPEPKTPAASSAPAATVNEGSHAPARRPRKQAASSSESAEAPVDPVWIPAGAAAPPAAAAAPTAAPAPRTAPAIGGPVQLSPFPPPPQTAAGAAPPTQ